MATVAPTSTAATTARTVRFAPSRTAEKVALTIAPGATATDSVSVDGPQLSLGAARYGGTAFCDGLDPSHNTLDATANGGPRAGCNFGVTFGLVQGIGCLYRVNTQVGHLDEPVLRAIALLYAEDPEYRAYVDAASTAAHLAKPDGNGLLGPKEVDTALEVSDFYVATSSVRINGLDFTPRHGTDIVLAPVLQRVITEDAVVTLGSAVVRQGRFVLDVSVKHHRVDVGEVDLTGQLPAIGAFPLTRQTNVAFVSPGTSELGVHVKPPAWTRLLIDDGAAPTFNATVRITNAGGFDVQSVDAELGVLSFGSWRLGDVDVGYRKFDDQGHVVDRWQITGALTLGALGDDGIYLTPPPLYGIIFEHGKFKSAGVESRVRHR